MRLVPHQEAPTNICWGDRNRSVLVRVPLGWTSGKDMCVQVNPHDKCEIETFAKQTFEMRSPDCSANVYELLAALCVGVRLGFEMEENDALKLAERTYVDVNIHAKENARRLASLATLPTCCVESAECLEGQREFYESRNVFAPAMIDGVIRQLKEFDDKELASRLQTDPIGLQKLVSRYFYCG